MKKITLLWQLLFVSLGALLAVGLWAVQLGGCSVWAAPLTFVGVMALGGVLPVPGISLPFVEQGIALFGVYLAVV